MRHIKNAILVALLFALAGCVSTASIIKELGKDHNQNCVIVTTVYGTVTMLRASPDSGFKASTGQCAIDAKAAQGTGAGTISVPVTVPPMTLSPSPKP